MIAYTDGACIPNPGRGAWAYVLVNEAGEATLTATDFTPQTTNNRMEYLALISALRDHGPILKEIRTDSMLLVNTATTWRHGWKLKGWKKNNHPVNGVIANLDLVQEIAALLDQHPHVKVTWVRGHNGDKFNEMADQLAAAAILEAE